MMQKLDIDVEEFLAWARGTPRKVTVPPPPPKSSTKTFSIIVPRSRDVVILPAAFFKREEP